MAFKFREPLVIEPNSKVYLNFAKFKRNSSVYFSSDQTIEVLLGDVLPTVIPADTSTSNSVMTLNSITIPSINPITGNQYGSMLTEKFHNRNVTTGGTKKSNPDPGTVDNSYYFFKNSYYNFRKI